MFHCGEPPEQICGGPSKLYAAIILGEESDGKVLSCPGVTGNREC